ncbi:acyltransferase family protein [Tsukamurella pulmonis]|uniref:acyltransferase family protein n=1 Tax=Tsukamurella pulmonis TaxID=47312 RepID=UPI0009EA1D79|nr:acyltransferase [Tsukamurella pulmonis]
MESAPRSSHVPALTGLRALAAFGVCVTHAAFWGGDFTPDAVGAAYARLETAVPVFFALSGFLLVRPWVRARAQGGAGTGPAVRPDVRRYFVARAWRILPAYWTVVTVVYVIYVWRPDLSSHGHGWVAYLRHLTFTQIYGVGAVHTGLTQMWSMCVEVAFYLVLPLLGLWLLRARRAWIVPVSMVALSVGWLVLVTATEVFGKTARSWPPGFAAAFAAGIAVALLVDRVRLPRWPLVLAAAVAYGVLLTPLAGPIDLRLPTPAQGVTKFLLEALIGGLLVAAFATGPSRVLGSRPMVWLGAISYEFFLIHVMVMEVVVLDLFGWSLFTGSTWPIVALTTVITVVLSWGLHVAVERLRAAVPRRPVVRAGRAG